MPKKEPIEFHKGDDGKRYLKKFEIVETEVELPIQGQVRVRRTYLNSSKIWRMRVFPK